MSASIDGFPQHTLPMARLTITEARVEAEARVESRRNLVLGSSKIYYYAAAGTVFGLLMGVAVGASLWIPNWMGVPKAPMKAAAAPVLAPAPHGSRDFGTVNAIAAGLKGHLVTEWQDKPTYRLAIEPADAANQAGFALTVAGSPRPLSVAFQLLDSTGAVLCGADVVVRYNAARPALTATEGKTGPAQSPAELARLEAQESARERGRDIFENEIGDDGQIAAIDAQGEMPCSAQAYQSAASWSLSPDFPSVAEQAELLKQQTESTAAQKTAPSHKTSTVKKPEAGDTTAMLDGFVAPPAGRLRRRFSERLISSVKSRGPFSRGVKDPEDADPA